MEPPLTNSITFTKAENVNDDVGTFLLGGVTDLAAKASYILATSSLSDQSQHCLDKLLRMAKKVEKYQELFSSFFLEINGSNRLVLVSIQIRNERVAKWLKNIKLNEI